LSGERVGGSRPGAGHGPGRLRRATPCAAIGRNAAGDDKSLRAGFTPDRGRALWSLEGFVDFAGRHRESGFTEVVVHWPIPDSHFAADEKVFEQIAVDAPAQLH
jgi:hypothetical protein